MQTLLLYVLAFLSGIAALIYQVAWSRMLSLAFGSTTLAVSAVVAGFMGGMGIGAWLYHRAGDRFAVPLRAYGMLELGIAASTALFTLLFLLLPEWFAAVTGSLDQGVVTDILRVATTFALLIVPTALMGATYPALCQSLIHSVDEVERRLGWIYGLNTLGAAVGAFAAGFALIEIFGSHGSVMFANAINLAVGAAALALARRSPEALGKSEIKDESLSSGLPYWLTGLVLFGSGFATIGYEIVWFRALHYVMGTGTYVLSASLVIFLLGLGLGGIFYRWALLVARPEWSLGSCQFAIAALALFAIAVEQVVLATPFLNNHISGFSVEVFTQSWLVRIAIAFGAALAIMLPATFWMGLAFPIASRLFLGSVRTLSTRVGFAYLLSNLGGIVGAILAAMWILPTLGTVGGTKFLACVNVALGSLILYRAPGIRLRAVAVAATAVVFLCISVLPSRLSFEWPIKLGPAGRIDLVFEEESHVGTVQVFSRSDIVGAQAMAIDGVVIAASEAWDPKFHAKQALLAHLPMNLDREIRRTLNLGVASGSTLKALAQYDQIETLDAVEINPAAIRGASYFLDSSAFEDPRTHLYVDDAVNFLLSTRNTYDLIISDAKQHIHFSGNAKILSSELYKYSLGRLSECGLFVQFLPALPGSKEIAELLLRTFRDVFPEVEIFVESPFYFITVGSRCPIGGRPGFTREELVKMGIAEMVESSFVPDASHLSALWVGSGREFQIEDGPINSWDKLPMEFLGYRLPPANPNQTAAVLGMLLSPRQSDRKGTAGFGEDPYFELSINILHAYLDWMHRDGAKANSAIAQIVKEYPNLDRAKLAQWWIRTRIQEAPE